MELQGDRRLGSTVCRTRGAFRAGTRSANPSDYVYFIPARNPLIEPNNVGVLAGVENESTGTLGAGRHKSPPPRAVAFFRSQSDSYLFPAAPLALPTGTKVHSFRFSLSLSAFTALFPRALLRRACARARVSTGEFLTPPVQGNALAVIFQA